MSWRSAFVGIAILTGCGSSGSGPSETTTDATEPGACPDGAIAIADSSECAPVGPSSAPPGFALEAATSTFRAIRPAQACTGATRAGIGETACVPIDDCAAAFPPADADIVLRSGDSLADAIADAPSGALIALDSGMYDGAIEVRRDVRLVGRCAAKVSIRGVGPKGDTNPMGIAGLGVRTGASLELSSVTVEGFDTAIASNKGNVTVDRVLLTNVSAGIIADNGSRVSISRSAIEGHSKRVNPVRGLVAQHGSRLDADEVDIRSTSRSLTAMDTGTLLRAKRSVLVSKGENDDIFMFSVVGARLEVEESFVQVEKQTLLCAGRATRLSGERDASVVTVTRSELDSAVYVRAGVMAVQGGAALDLRNSTIRGDSATVISAFEAPSQVTLTSTTLRVKTDAGKSAAGITAIHGASVTMDGSIVANARGTGIFVSDSGARVSLRRSLVTGTRAGPAPKVGEGSAMALVVLNDAALDLVDSTLSDNEQSALLVADEAQAALERATITDTIASPRGALGYGITVMADAVLTMRSSVVRTSADVALSLGKAQATVLDSRFEGNLFGVSLWESTFREGGEGIAGSRELVVTGTTFDNDPWLIEREIGVVLPSPP